MSEALTSQPVLQSLPAETREAILAQCPTRIFKKEEELCYENEPTSDLYLINYGLVRITRYSEQGVKVSFIDMGAGGMFGEISAIDGLPRSANVVALEDTRVTIIHQGLFDQLLDTQPKFTRLILEQLCKVIRRLDDRVYEFSALGVKNRIHAELLRLASSEGITESDNRVKLDQPPTHEEIAARISTHREAVSREFRWLKTQKLVENKGRQIWITDLKRLQALVENVGEEV